MGAGPAIRRGRLTNCKRCGREFIGWTSKTRFCSMKCVWPTNRWGSRPKKTTEQHMERFASKVIKGGDDCWSWKGSHDGNGYGVFDANGKRTQAHRISYTMAKGPIPEGLELDHLCRNRGCVNPDHLEAVTHKENILRGQTVAARNAAKTHCVRGHKLSGGNVKMVRGARHCLPCDAIRHANQPIKER